MSQSGNYSSPRRHLIAGNWKMNGILEEAKQFVAELAENPSPDHLEVALMPPFTLLHPLAEPLSQKGVQLGAQSVYHEPKGAFTGSICPVMLRDAGCHYVIVGHSERRDIMGEANELISKKLAAAWSNGLEPILCVGEHLEERQDGETNSVLRQQLSVLEDAPESAALTVAYEPVWAIGTGLTASPEQVTETHAFIHEELTRLGHDCRVLYGGSVKPENTAELMACSGVEGALVGGASLQAESFSKIVQAAASVAAGA
ncbi:MAG: triose-phosphate isomerase [Mariprofundaceae bacterium]|nr:triose-phosphate isomerase [Mariprofundaceae bacterium]